MAETSSCRIQSCGTTVAGKVEWCPRCGSLMRTSRDVRRRGWVMLVCGVVLSGMILGFSTIASMAYGQPVTIGPLGGLGETILFAAPVALIGLIGLVAVVAGGWQAATGRPLRHTGTALIALVVGVVLAVWIAQLADGTSTRPLPPRRTMLP